MTLPSSHVPSLAELGHGPVVSRVDSERQRRQLMLQRRRMRRASCSERCAPGDIVEDKDGYGRIYLIPRGFAMPWTKGGEKQVVAIKRSRDAREIRDLGHAKEVKAQLEDLAVVVNAKAGDDQFRRRRRLTFFSRRSARCVTVTPLGEVLAEVQSVGAFGDVDHD